ncbi:MAG TPA: hypothetical protein VIA06_15190 [Candidatus Dormibacteraeota bacterium]|nr:hypothetical protein [Candidatus Dormibacteraeota bacterium]
MRRPAVRIVPPAFPTIATTSQTAVSCSASPSSAGCHRIEATGPGSSEGRTAVDVGVTPNRP